MVLFDSNLDEQFKGAVLNIKTRNDISKTIHINENSILNESIKLKQVADYLNKLKLTSLEVNKQFKRYSFLYDIYYGKLSFNRLSNKNKTTELFIRESIEGTHLPTEGPIKERNVQSVKYVYERLKRIYHISDWQFLVDDSVNGVEVTEIKKAKPSFNTQREMNIIIPNIYDNIKIIDKEMDAMGYFKSEQQKIPIDGKQYIVLDYNPKEQDSITDYIRKNCLFLFHAAPTVFDESIVKNGFVLKSGSPVYNYPPRTFFNVNKENWDYYINMMKEVSKSHKKDKAYTNNYYIYVIAVKKIPDDIDFYADPNATDCCFTTQTIPYDCVIGKVEETF